MGLEQWLQSVIGTAMLLAGIVSALVAVAKTTAGDRLPSRYYPVIALSLGVVVAYVISFASGLIPLREAPIDGGLAGLISAGLFTWGKSGEPTSTRTLATATTTGPLKPPSTVVTSTTESTQPAGTPTT